jgi:hypothetical protein
MTILCSSAKFLSLRSQQPYFLIPCIVNHPQTRNILQCQMLRAVRLKVGCNLDLWQGRPVRSSPYPSAQRLSSGHWRLFGEKNVEGVSRSFPYMLRFWYTSFVDNFILTSHRIISLGLQGAGSSLLQLLFPEKSYAGVRDMFRRWSQFWTLLILNWILVFVLLWIPKCD